MKDAENSRLKNSTEKTIPRPKPDTVKKGIDVRMNKIYEINNVRLTQQSTSQPSLVIWLAAVVYSIVNLDGHCKYMAKLRLKLQSSVRSGGRGGLSERSANILRN